MQLKIYVKDVQRDPIFKDFFTKLENYSKGN